MMHNKSIDELIAEIIPPNDREHRENFNNEALIDLLTDNKRQEVESKLLIMLAASGELLVARTLAYMKSMASVPVIRDQMMNCISPLKRMALASYLYYIMPDRQLIDVAVEAYSGLNNIYEKIFSFYLLRTFQSPETDQIIKGNITSSEYLISYNAKRAMTMDSSLPW